MPRIRTIKPEFWSDASIVRLPFEYRLLFQGLWNFADDSGFIVNDPVQIKLHVFPADDVDVAKGIRELKKQELVEVVKLGGVSVIKIANWKHQRIDKPQPSKFAPMYDEYQAQHTIPGTFQERSQNVPAGKERKGKERKGKEESQVGGGGYLSSGDATPPPPISELAEPWRCERHQGIDTPCLSCKNAKETHKASEAARVAAEKAARAQAERERLERERLEREAALTDFDPTAGQKAIAQLRAVLHKKENNS